MQAKLFGHYIHPMLIVFPVGLFVTALIFDVIRLVTGTPMWGYRHILDDRCRDHWWIASRPLRPH